MGVFSSSQKSKDGVSIVICCYNSAGRLAPALAHLRAQVFTAPLPWEVIIVDNASTDATAQTALDLWPPDAGAPLRVVREAQPGLSHARQRGLREAQYAFVSFIDDDNWVSPDWVERVYQIFCAHPEVAACGGRISAAFEAQPPEWFDRFAGRFAVGEQYAQAGYVPDGRALWGAGLSIRKSAWERLTAQGFSPLLSDRTGGHLSAGGDSELCLALALNGWKLWYEPGLHLQHFMPRGRLTWENLSRMSRGFGAAQVTLRMYVVALIGYWLQFPERQDRLRDQRKKAFQAMTRSPRALLSALTYKGAPHQAALELQESIGAWQTLLRLGPAYERRKRAIRGAAWNTRGDSDGRVRRLRILQVSISDTGGGAERSALYLFRRYRELGHKSWLAVGRRNGHDPDTFAIKAKHPPAYLVRRGILFFEHRLIPYSQRSPKVRIWRRLLRSLADGSTNLRGAIDELLGIENFEFPNTRRLLNLTPQRPDIVHLHNLHGDYFDLRFLPELSRQVPVILNLRDMWTLTGHCAYPLDCQRWKEGCGSCPYLDVYPAVTRDATHYNRRRKQHIFHNSRLYVTAPTRWLMEQAQASGMFQALEYRVIPNAIDLHTFRPGDRLAARRQLGLPPGVKIILLIAHSVFKDLETMRQALALLPAYDAPTLFLCAGRAGETQPLGHGEIRYLGRVEDAGQMAALYQAADVYIHAAHNEVFGKTIIESMACGTPVVATAVDGIPELIEEGVNGYLTPARDAAAMASRVQFLLENPLAGEAIGQHAAQEARERYNLEHQADEFLSWYAEILRGEQAQTGETPNP